MTDQTITIEPPSLTPVVTVARADIRAIPSVEVGGETHWLGEHRDFRRHDALARFLPEHGRFSLAWVRLCDGERLDVHQHPTKSMILVCKGSVRLVGDLEESLGEGDVVCVPPGARHGFHTGPGEDFQGLSVQFEGAGLYENENAPRVRFAEVVSDSMAGLERLNDSRLRRFAEHPLFALFDSGRMHREPVLRDRFVSVLYVWSVFFQRMLYARQSVCTDPSLREIYADHLRDEFGHDRLLRDRHAVSANVYDPILEAAGNWFVMQMHSTDEAAKIVIVHMVVESSCHVFGERTRSAFQDGPAAETSYFDVHAEVDGDHRDIGRDHLRTLPPARFPQLSRTCEEAWDQLELVFDRMAALTRS
ncbi:quercetin dioxygenase-like cupin family protein [Streptosporangium album]|uniref:Quercetin dioxygenase-like cupin family protein n=1 Tax=Streptosporangium album TaxID=47479 RepID=A0A7W7RQY5_9ACTN|nr:cupin domain-containing protein [Streptosporangium album]MBB4936575.1 quercetin dioxygenase-like cupin family protein [Streptosporangium album]